MKASLKNSRITRIRENEDGERERIKIIGLRAGARAREGRLCDLHGVSSTIFYG